MYHNQRSAGVVVPATGLARGDGVRVRVTQDMSKHPNFGMSLQGLDYNCTVHILFCSIRIGVVNIHILLKLSYYNLMKKGNYNVMS